MATKSFSNSSIKTGLKASVFKAITAAVPTTGISVQYLVIGGGGGGAYDNGGGGGSGGYRCNVTGENSGGGASAEPALYVPSATYTISIGAGGTGCSGNGSTVENTEGTPSYLTGTGVTPIVSVGGGKAASYRYNAGRGGSGGGMHRNNSSGVSNFGAGLKDQGYAGGSGYLGIKGGGGGGAGAIGGDAPASSSGAGGAGGNGVASSITGSSVTRGGGGGGGSEGNPGTNAAGGSGGGGTGGARYATTDGGNGSANTGGGGGGTEYNPSNSTVVGNGGSGVVIIRATQAASATTGSPTATTSGSWYIYTFTGSGSITY